MNDIQLKNFEFHNINNKINHKHIFMQLIWTFDLELSEELWAQIEVDLFNDQNYRSSQNTDLPPPEERSVLRHGTCRSIDSLSEFFRRSTETFFDLVQGQAKAAGDFSIQQVFRNRWYARKQWMLDNTHVGVYVAKDGAGFHMGHHVDNALTVGTLIVNLQDNGDSGTDFFSVDGAHVFRAPGRKGSGVFFVNTPGAIHGITNSLPRDRFVVLGNWMLKYSGS